jgi:hypothetical protein
MIFQGRARDIVTTQSGAPPLVCQEDSFVASLQPDRTIVAIEATPPRPALAGLIGERGGGGFRKALQQVLPNEQRDSTPLSLILDDIAGTSLVAGWAWSQWDANWLENSRKALQNFDLEKAFASRTGICIGFAPGSSAFDSATDRSSSTPASDLPHPQDPDGWHELPVQSSVAMRRARFIDVSLTDVISVHSGFQDSASTPSGARAAVHEYRMSLTADPDSLCVLSLEAEPRVLPYAECTVAPSNLKSLIGTPLPQLRDKVLAELRGIAGCTHLNDAMRALAQVPALVSRLQDAAGRGGNARAVSQTQFPALRSIASE